MNYTKGLAATGSGGLVIGGVFIGQPLLFGLAITIVIASAIAIRVFWRNEKKLNEV